VGTPGGRFPVRWDEKGERRVGPLAITECEKLLAFLGVGADHHLPSRPIASAHTRQAIEHTVYADGATVPSRRCWLLPLTSSFGVNAPMPAKGRAASIACAPTWSSSTSRYSASAVAKWSA
jgi:hypothetical protein